MEASKPDRGNEGSFQVIGDKKRKSRSRRHIEVEDFPLGVGSIPYDLVANGAKIFIVKAAGLSQISRHHFAGNPAYQSTSFTGQHPSHFCAKSLQVELDISFYWCNTPSTTDPPRRCRSQFFIKLVSLQWYFPLLKWGTGYQLGRKWEEETVPLQGLLV
ncbi:hypothetical protein L7F22_034959 [Adiantum nelumboides]|nr:hypothetical protein [Adiantum nelumboides]